MCPIELPPPKSEHFLVAKELTLILRICLSEETIRNDIIDVSLLETHYPIIYEITRKLLGNFNIDVSDNDYSHAFIYYLFFSQCSVENVIPNLNKQAKFYNSYYWFKRFVALYARIHGYDAGLEQQAFKILELSNFEIDFELTDQLDKLAKQ